MRNMLVGLFIGFMWSSNAEAQPAAQEPSELTGYQLKQAVIISRHGVRSPTKPQFLLAQYADKPWPIWPVSAGKMTPRGKALMTQMGHFYGQYFRKYQLISASDCPEPGQVYVWADVDQRTRLTGHAFVEGMAPGCQLPVHHQPNVHKADPLFHPPASGQCRLDVAQVERAVEHTLGGKVAQLSEKYANELNAMSEVLNFKRAVWCRQKVPDAELCSFAHFQPNQLQVDANYTKVRLLGPVGLASTLAEIFLLQDAEGMPQPAWGRITATDTWQALLKLHNTQVDLISRTPYLAQHKATRVMNVVYAALSATVGQTVASRLTVPRNNKILFLAAHDTTIANIAGMLGMHWQLPDQFDNTPPDGGLMFELWQAGETKQYWVKVQLIYQTLAQLREKQTLDIHTNPARSVTLYPSGCKQQLCSWPQISQLMQNSMLKHCL